MNGLGEGSTTGHPLEHNSLPFVRALFNDTAPHYDTVHQIFSLGSGNWYRRRCLTRAGLKPGQKLLDIAIGTGLTVYELTLAPPDKVNGGVMVKTN